EREAERRCSGKERAEEKDGGEGEGEREGNSGEPTGGTKLTGDREGEGEGPGHDLDDDDDDDDDEADEDISEISETEAGRAEVRQAKRGAKASVQKQKERSRVDEAQ